MSWRKTLFDLFMGGTMLAGIVAIGWLLWPIIRDVFRREEK